MVKGIISLSMLAYILVVDVADILAVYLFFLFFFYIIISSHGLCPNLVTYPLKVTQFFHPQYRDHKVYKAVRTQKIEKKKKKKKIIIF